MSITPYHVQDVPQAAISIEMALHIPLQDIRAALAFKPATAL